MEHSLLNLGAVQARGVYQVTLALKERINTTVTKTDVNSLPDKGKTEFIGIFLSFVVLRALAAELALKVLYSQQTGSDAKHSHDLSELFQALPCKTRDSISQRFQSKRQGEIVKEVFAAHKDDFVDWRYVYQDPPQHTGIGAFEAAIEATLEEIGIWN